MVRDERQHPRVDRRPARDGGADARPIAPITQSDPTLDIGDAYEIQRINVERKLAAGAQVVGHKVGLSSPAMQRMMGVEEPDFGHLLDTMVLSPGTPVGLGALIQPRVEVEVGVVLKRSLPPGGCTVDDVAAAVDHVVAAIELIDSRIVDWRIGIVDTIADNASSAAFALGARHVSLTEIPDIRLTGALLWRNGELVESGAAGAVLGNPLSSVAWLANTLAPFGVTLAAGDVILPGSCTRAVDVRPGDTVVAEFDRLGEVALEFIDHEEATP